MLATLMQLPPFQTADEMRGLSNLAHLIEGVVLAIAALIVRAEAPGRLRGERGRIAWPSIILFAGVVLLGYLLIPHHGLANARAQWGFIFGVPQQRQHVVLAALVVIGGGAELLSRRGRLRGRAWSLRWPVAAATAGILFIAHPQHGTSRGDRACHDAPPLDRNAPDRDRRHARRRGARRQARAVGEVRVAGHASRFGRAARHLPRAARGIRTPHADTRRAAVNDRGDTRSRAHTAGFKATACCYPCSCRRPPS
jgi:hypothetical protein